MLQLNLTEGTCGCLDFAWIADCILLSVTMFRSVGDELKLSSNRIRRVKTVLEHVGLYVGLALYTAVGGLVGL